MRLNMSLYRYADAYRGHHKVYQATMGWAAPDAATLRRRRRHLAWTSRMVSDTCSVPTCSGR